MLTETEMAIIQSGNTEQIRALAFQLAAQRDEQAKTIEWQRKLIDNGVPTSGFTGEAQADIAKIASGRLRDIKSVSGLQKDNNELKAKLAQGKTE